MNYLFIGTLRIIKLQKKKTKNDGVPSKDHVAS